MPRSGSTGRSAPLSSARWSPTTTNAPSTSTKNRINDLGLGSLLGDDLHAPVDAFVADVDAGAGDQLLDLALVLTTKRARQGGGGLPRAGSAPPDAEPHPLSFPWVLSLTVGGGRAAVGPGRRPPTRRRGRRPPGRGCPG